MLVPEKPFTHSFLQVFFSLELRVEEVDLHFFFFFCCKMNELNYVFKVNVVLVACSQLIFLYHFFVHAQGGLVQRGVDAKTCAAL